MSGRHVLVAVSAAQLAAGVVGQLVALRTRRPFDTALGLKGQPERVGRDSWINGTALSAPVYMLATQAVLTTRLAAGPSRPTTRALGVFGAAMLGGYLIEREVRPALTPGGFDAVVTPVAGSGITLAVGMAVLGLRRHPG
jgi:hypothetical protein